jgi:hypothetical protein
MSPYITPECEDKKGKVSPKVSPTTYVGRRLEERRCKRDELIITIKQNVNDF